MLLAFRVSAQAQAPSMPFSPLREAAAAGQCLTSPAHISQPREACHRHVLGPHRKRCEVARAKPRRGSVQDGSARDGSARDGSVQDGLVQDHPCVS